MCDCDKLIDPFCGNTIVVITGNAVWLARIRSLATGQNHIPHSLGYWSLLCVVSPFILYTRALLLELISKSAQSRHGNDGACTLLKYLNRLAELSLLPNCCSK